MNKLSCLIPASERKVRQLEKRRRLLRFLRGELWSTAELLGQVLGLQSRQAVWKSLRQFEAEQIIRRHEYSVLGGSLLIWGITAHGQGLAFNPESETVRRHYFEPSKVSEFTLRHTLDIQRLRLAAELAGWSDWQNGESLGAVGKGLKRPDAIAIDPAGIKTAIECERTLKTVKRYEVVLSAYLQSLKRDEYSRVVWVCPTADISLRLQAIICGIESVTVAGQRVRIDPQRHHLNLRFEDYETFAKSGNALAGAGKSVVLGE